MGNLTRERIIDTIHKNLEENMYVNALWLEGSDPLNCEDEYSDIDMVVDVEDGHEEEVFNQVEVVLSSIGELDLNYEDRQHDEKLRQKMYHIKDTSQYLLVDFCVQSHSRDKECSTFCKGDVLEAAKVIFDRGNVVSYEEVKREDRIEKEVIIERLRVLEGRYKQHCRVIKYVERGNYPEAFMYYLKYVADPIVELNRLIYTPEYFYIHMIHISHHMSDNVIKEFEKFYQVKNFEDIRRNTKDSKELFYRLVNEVREKYNL
ncbi:hypothetical protein [Oceanirhabdus seepicola]|uniref:Uncharacterized protein n=1 Tax=Oceanirhabdus seepicola TaxID=2828781 RepID=A0A9J6P3Y4_9CLOT|nr:hypothetical protein [Oceanirhabdus seepicola]MCM1990761.1 hypothetical protein [Oceanirhabdus seepicola]